MDQKSRQKHEVLARTLRYILGKSPDEFGLVLDDEGWIDYKTLILALGENPGTKGVSIARIRDLSWAVPDCPFEFEESRIRLAPSAEFLPPMREYQPPPTLLYYGCRRKPYKVYLEKGIAPPDGREILLARTKEMALRIGARRDPKPVLVDVNTDIAASHGAFFQAYGAHLFVVDRLPKEALFGPPIREEDALPKRKPKPKPKEGETGLPHPPSPESLLSKPWDPRLDRLLGGELPIEVEEAIKRERQKKKVGWKDDLQKRKRKREPTE